MKKVCHISTVHSFDDDRIFQKECATLVEEGYEVYFIVTYNKEECIDGVNIIPLKESKSRIYRVFVKNLSALIKALKLKADLYHFHDPELIFIGRILKLFRKKVVYDVHEDVPMQILSKDYLGSERKRKIISSAFNFFEKGCAKHYDAVVSVIPEIVHKFNCNKRPTLIRNLPVTSIIKEAEPVSKNTDKRVIVYAGGLMRIRGLKEIIQAIEKFKGDVEFWILGKWDDETYRKECESLKGYEYVKYLGYKPVNEVYSYMKAADLGVCILYPVQNYLKSLPIKAFEYMACGIPMLMSNFPYWEEKFKGSAEFVSPMKPDEIYEKLKELLNDKEKCSELKNNALDMVQNNYSWEAEKKVLLKLYNDILN